MLLWWRTRDIRSSGVSLFSPSPRNSMSTRSGASGVMTSHRKADPRRLKLTPGNMSIMYQWFGGSPGKESDSRDSKPSYLSYCTSNDPTVTWPFSNPVFWRAK